MEQINSRSLAVFLSTVVFCAGCDQSGSGLRLTQAKYDQVSIGMSKTEVEKIFGPPTTEQTKQALLFGDQARWQPVSTCRYEEGATFIEITFKDDQVDKKDSNLGKGP
jgi:outer membrane protein assembly factor BamE (lipoprotein component of BamABCDE complex)